MEATSLARASAGVVYSRQVFTLPETGCTSRISAISYQCHSFEGSLISALRCLPPRTYSFSMPPGSPNVCVCECASFGKYECDGASFIEIVPEVIRVDCDAQMNLVRRAPRSMVEALEIR